MLRFLRSNWLLLTILALALLVRLYRLPATLTFLEDEGRDLLVIKRMFDTGKPMLLGPQTSTGNMYLGPAYYYIIAPALLLSGMSPLGPAILIAISGVVTVYLLYYLGKRWFTPRTGYLAGLLYALMPLPVAFTRNSWNPNLAPLVSLLTAFFVVRIIKHEGSNKHNFLALGVLLALLIQLHYMTLLFVVAVALVLAVFWRDKVRILVSGLMLALVAGLLTFSPFIVFELRNNFVNTRAITRFVEAKEEHNIRYSLPYSLWSSKVSSSLTRLFASEFGRDALTKDPYRVPITIAVSLLLVFGGWRRRQDKTYLILLFLFLCPLTLLGIYQENIHLHYLGFLFPIVYLLVAATPLSWVIALPLLFYSLPQTVSYLSSGNTHQLERSREVAAYISQKAGDKPYNVASREGTPVSPYLYFLSLQKNPPTTKRTETLFLICEGELCGQNDIHTPFIYITGPSHPTITTYLGHPLYNHFEGERQVVNGEHVSNGAFVTTLKIKDTKE